MATYTDPTTGEYVGEYEYRDASDPTQVRRDTEWFATQEVARQFSRTGDTETTREQGERDE